MKRLLCVNILIITLLSSVKIFAQSAMIFDAAEHSFGNIRENGGRVSHSFRFRNAGNEPVVVLSVTTTCGCTAAKFAKRRVG